MQTAGYLLAGGASSRMGVNKALLTLGGRTFLEIAADAVRQAAGSVTVVGSPDIYREFGFAVIPDLRPNAGPLAAIETALSHSAAEWNLIVACDMPRIACGTLRRILDQALSLEALAHPEAACVMPQSGVDRVEPLCAAYHKRALSAISEALTAGIRKVTDGLPREWVHYIQMTDDPIFQNINTPEQWGELNRSFEP